MEDRCFTITLTFCESQNSLATQCLEEKRKNAEPGWGLESVASARIYSRDDWESASAGSRPNDRIQRIQVRSSGLRDGTNGPWPIRTWWAPCSNHRWPIFALA